VAGKQNLRLGVEGALIVVSILLAFAIDAWWDGRQEGKEEAAVLQGLHAEFRGHQEAITSTLLRYGQAEEDLRWLVRRGGSDQDPYPLDSLRWALQWALGSPTFDPPTGTILGLLSSGRLERISRAELRSALAAWPAMVEDIRENEESIRAFVTLELVPALAGKGLFLGTLLSPGVPWPREDDEGVWRAAVPVVQADPEVRNLLAHRYHWVPVTVQEYREAQTLAQRILSLLDEELLAYGVSPETSE